MEESLIDYPQKGVLSAISGEIDALGQVLLYPFVLSSLRDPRALTEFISHTGWGCSLFTDTRSSRSSILTSVFVYWSSPLRPTAIRERFPAETIQNLPFITSQRHSIRQHDSMELTMSGSRGNSATISRSEPNADGSTVSESTSIQVLH